MEGTGAAATAQQAGRTAESRTGELCQAGKSANATASGSFEIADRKKRL